jgi:hypothetical protein
MGTEAVVRAHAERQMGIGPAAEVELAGGGKGGFVTVGGNVVEDDLVAGLDLAAAQGGVGLGRAAELPARRPAWPARPATG